MFSETQSPSCFRSDAIYLLQQTFSRSLKKKPEIDHSMTKAYFLNHRFKFGITNDLMQVKEKIRAQIKKQQQCVSHLQKRHSLKLIVIPRPRKTLPIKTEHSPKQSLSKVITRKTKQINELVQDSIIHHDKDYLQRMLEYTPTEKTRQMSESAKTPKPIPIPVFRSVQKAPPPSFRLKPLKKASTILNGWVTENDDEYLI